jgi:hypothetical protein
MKRQEWTGSTGSSHDIIKTNRLFFVLSKADACPVTHRRAVRPTGGDVLEAGNFVKIVAEVLARDAFQQVTVTVLPAP